ncbi:hypothetical protein B2G50_19125 [Leptospira interrogans serovar Canicola]|nr:hypothetical protein B2G50_19125 [Leptospira interrogans serovar Canicola]
MKIQNIKNLFLKTILKKFCLLKLLESIGQVKMGQSIDSNFKVGKLIECCPVVIICYLLIEFLMKLLLSLGKIQNVYRP